MSLSEVVEAAAAAARPDTAGGFFFGKPMAAVEFMLTTVHDTAGIPWWATIGVTTLGMRLAVLPFQVYQSKALAKLNKIKPETTELTAKMREAAARMDEKGTADAEKYRKQLELVFNKEGVRPWKSIVGALAQLPLWVTFFFTLRHVTRPGGGLGMEEGGMLWFNDLTSPDPYYALPALCGASFYGMAALGDPGQAGMPQDDKAKMMKTFMKGVAVGMPVMTYWMSSGVFIYWISTNVIGVSTTVFLRQPPIRDALGMPPIPTVPGMLPLTPATLAPAAPNTTLSLQGSLPPPVAQAAKIAVSAAKKGKKKAKKKGR